MLFDWAKLIEVAEHLADVAVETCDGEACCRASTSRAYYASFGVARQFAERSSGKRFDGGAHFKVQRHLRESGDPNAARIANRLKTLHAERTKADYRNGAVEAKRARATAKKSIAMSRKTIEEIRAMESDSEPARD